MLTRTGRSPLFLTFHPSRWRRPFLTRTVPLVRNYPLIVYVPFTPFVVCLSRCREVGTSRITLRSTVPFLHEKTWSRGRGVSSHVFPPKSRLSGIELLTVWSMNWNSFSGLERHVRKWVDTFCLWLLEKTYPNNSSNLINYMSSRILSKKSRVIRSSVNTILFTGYCKWTHN